MFSKFTEKAIETMIFIILSILTLGLIGLVVGLIGSILYPDTGKNTEPIHTITGTITNKGYSVKPIYYWIDVDGREFNPNDQTYNNLHVGEHVRVAYQGDTVVKVEESR